MAKANQQLKAFEDFIAFLRINSKEVSNADGSGTELLLWESQRRFLQNVAEGLNEGVRTFYCLKSRQLGVTTVSLAIDIFWLAMHPGIVGALVTEDEKNRDKNRQVIKQYIESFPEDYFGDEFKIEINNRQQMTFSNGSRLDFKIAGTKKKSTSWGEGEGYTFAHVTEVASYGDMDGLRSFEESFAQTNPARLYLYESTAKGFNLWRDKWLSGFADPLTKRSFFIGWWSSGVNRIEQDDPRFAKYGRSKPDAEERDKIKLVKEKYDYQVTPEQLAWYRWREATDEAGADMLSQNQPWTAEDAFVQSGQSFFPTRVLTQDMRDLDGKHGYLAYAYQFGATFFDMTLHFVDDDSPYDIELKVWEEPAIGGEYVIGCDPAYGRTEHGDAIAIEVWRCYADKIVQVAEYATADVDVKQAAWVLAHLAGAYGNCMVNLELGGGGRMIMMEWDHVRSMLNSEMYARYARSGNWEDALDQARWYLYSRADMIGGRPSAYNFETSWRTKQELMHGFRGAYMSRELDVRSMMLLREMTNVVQDGSTIGAPDSSDPNSKDDRVFASAFAHRAWIEWFRKGMIANGQSFEMVQRAESGAASQTERSINGMVHRFFARAAQMAGEVETAPSWRVERGLM